MKEKTEKEKALEKAIEEMEKLLGGPKVCGLGVKTAKWCKENSKNYKGGIVYF